MKLIDQSSFSCVLYFPSVKASVTFQYLCYFINETSKSIPQTASKPKLLTFTCEAMFSSISSNKLKFSMTITSF